MNFTEYMLNNWHKFVLAFALIFGYAIGSNLYFQSIQIDKTEEAVAAMEDHTGIAAQTVLARHTVTNDVFLGGWSFTMFLVAAIFLGDIRRLARKASPAAVLLLVCLAVPGCMRKPFEPVELKTIASNEEAFLIPLTGDNKKQAAGDNEAYLKSNLVYTKQVQIPQQWHQQGYDTGGYNGKWEDAAVLIKVDKSPVTREWTADPNSGTSTKNEAVWVMTSDQVEFSTGWTITARISSRDDAVKFLHNYPNGSLTKVLDAEVRGKLQAVFGLEVTDLPMDELRKNATPHILKTTKDVTDFFKERGVSITNLGITGGFVYKDSSIQRKLVEVFNAEQEKSIAVAKTNTQTELNKSVILSAQGQADAILKTRKAEADGIKLVADARLYELDKASANLEAYLKINQIQLETLRLKSWDGKLPTWYYSSGSSGGPVPILQMPAMEKAK